MISTSNVRLHYLDLLINLFEHGWNDKRFLHSLDFLSSGPDVPEEDLFAFRADRYSGTEREVFSSDCENNLNYIQTLQSSSTHLEPGQHLVA